MESILQHSKIYRGCRYKDKILAAAQNPINQPLVKQMESYIDKDKIVDEPNKFQVDVDDNNILDDDKSGAPKVSAPSKHSSPSGGFRSGSPLDFDESPDVDELDESEVSDMEEGSPEGETLSEDDTEVIEEDEPEVESSTQISASTYVTVETVTQAVNEIPGTLNNRVETKGVAQALIKSSSGNELWIYYNDDVDASDVMESVNQALIASGYYFLEFDRVARDANALVFVINWISNYFQPVLSKE